MGTQGGENEVSVRVDHISEVIEGEFFAESTPFTKKCLQLPDWVGQKNIPVFLAERPGQVEPVDPYKKARLKIRWEESIIFSFP